MQILFQMDDSHPMLIVLVAKKWSKTILLDSEARMDVGFTWPLRIYMLTKAIVSKKYLAKSPSLFLPPLPNFCICITSTQKASLGSCKTRG